MRGRSKQTASRIRRGSTRQRPAGPLRGEWRTTLRSSSRFARQLATRQLLVAQGEERRRIARELHDGVAATLVALSLDLARLVGRLQTGDSHDLAASCASMCEQSLRELRGLAFVLHPPVLEREGLVVALRWLAEGFSTRTGIQVQLDAGCARGRRLEAHVELTLYRVAQEALTNVLRHSRSRTARASLAIGAREVRLTVRDEGRAASALHRAGAVREGVGISSMRERVRALGGRFAVAFGATGTVVTAVVPRR